MMLSVKNSEKVISRNVSELSNHLQVQNEGDEPDSPNSTGAKVGTG